MVATLAAQFFLTWAFIRVSWLYNYNASGAIEGPNKEMFGIIMIGPQSFRNDAILFRFGNSYCPYLACLQCY